jgi:hypothetical protein
MTPYHTAEVHPVFTVQRFVQARSTTDHPLEESGARDTAEAFPEFRSL